MTVSRADFTTLRFDSGEILDHSLKYNFEVRRVVFKLFQVSSIFETNMKSVQLWLAIVFDAYSRKNNRLGLHKSNPVSHESRQVILNVARKYLFLQLRFQPCHIVPPAPEAICNKQPMDMPWWQFCIFDMTLFSRLVYDFLKFRWRCNHDKGWCRTERCTRF